MNEYAIMVAAIVTMAAMPLYHIARLGSGTQEFRRGQGRAIMQQCARDTAILLFLASPVFIYFHRDIGAAMLLSAVMSLVWRWVSRLTDPDRKS